MRVPLSWLRDYVDFDLPPERLAEQLTVLGMEVQGIERIGSGWSSVVVGELLEVAPHPNADRLSLTKVRVSDTDAPLSVVCGATNIAVGQRVPVALPGAVLPGGKQIGVSTIQGTPSHGMLCSGSELGLTADSDGILILADGPGGGAPRLGTSLEDVVGDVVLDIDVKPNRGDALSMIGLAREVAAISGTHLKWPPIEVPESGDSTEDHLWVEVADKRLCPRFVGRYVDSVKIGPSPVRVQLRLSAAGLRPVSNAVDASNYVMLEMGKPIHVFDAGSVSGGTIVVRTAHEGETLETLDHVVRTLTTGTLVIADSAGVIGIAGVMGGANSEVSAQSTAVIVESAVFDPVSIRRTAFRYGLRSEASLRFEKGQESRLARVGADRTAQLLAQWAGGRPAVGATDTNPDDEPQPRVAFRPARVSRLLGQTITAAEMVDALAAVEIKVEAATDGDELPNGVTANEALVAVVPTHRRDIAIEADVAEEVCRVRGYDMLPPRLPETRLPSYRPDPRRFKDTLRDLLSGRGMSEVITNGLVAPIDHERVGIPADDPGTVRIANPVTADHSELRRTLLPGMLGVVARNERQRIIDLALYELGNLQEWRGGEPHEAEVLGVMLAGAWRSASWTEAARPASLEDLKGIVEALLARAGVGEVSYSPASAVRRGVEHPGRSAIVAARAALSEDGLVIGRIFEVDPRLVAAYEVRAEHVVYAILDVSVMERLAAERGVPKVREIDRLPIVERDIAVVVAQSVSAGRVADVIRSSAGTGLVSLDLFDRYTGAPLEAGQVSLAYRLRFQPSEDSTTEATIDGAIDDVIAALEKRVGGRIRSGS